MGLKLLSVALPNIYHFRLTIFSNKVPVGVKTVATVYGSNQLQSYKIVSKKNHYYMNTFLGTKVFINQCITLKFIFTTTSLGVNYD